MTFLSADPFMSIEPPSYPTQLDVDARAAGHPGYSQELPILIGNAQEGMIARAIRLTSP